MFAPLTGKVFAEEEAIETAQVKSDADSFFSGKVFAEEEAIETSF